MSAAHSNPPRSRRDLLYAELEALPAHLKGQIIDGELIVQPRPAIPHARAASRLHLILGAPFDLGHGGPGGWQIMFEPEVHLGDDVVVPDLAGWRIVEGGEDLLQFAAVPHAPDWLCEVLSPSTARIDRSRKLAIYGREGVSHVWLLDPRTQLLEVFTREGEQWRVEVVDTTDVAASERRLEPFGEVPLDLRDLWPATPKDGAEDASVEANAPEQPPEAGA